MNTCDPPAENGENPPQSRKRPKSGWERLAAYRARRKAAGLPDSTRKNRRAERKAWKARKRGVDLPPIEAD